MAEQVQKSKAAPQEAAPQTPHSDGGEQADLSQTDALLDEIDAMLEENAEEFVRNYVQKGGQ